MYLNDIHQRSSRADFISLAETTLAWQWVEQSMQNLNPHIIDAQFQCWHLMCPLASGVSPCHVVCVISLLRPRCTSCNAGLQTLQDYNKLQGLIGQIGQFTNSSKGKVPLQQGHSLLRSTGWRNTKRVGATGCGGASWGDHKNLVSLADSRRKNMYEYLITVCRMRLSKSDTAFMSGTNMNQPHFPVYSLNI